jgi:repressor LexA
MPPRQPLTERQTQIYEYLRTHLREHRRPPTIHEIGEELAIRSTNGVFKQLKTLEEKGYIRRERGVPRGITLVDPEDDPLEATTGPPALLLASTTSSFEPDQLRRRPEGSLHVDPHLLDRADPDACLVVRADDDGMNEDGIRKGDYLVVEELEWQRLRTGDVVAALVRERLLVRRFEFANGYLHLRSPSRHYTELTFPPDSPECFPIGRVLSVMRKL